MTEDTIHLLIADADPSVRGIIRVGTEEEGWTMDEAGDGIAALKLFRRKQYHLAVLEADLPELDGKLVARQIRKTSTIPIIFLSKHGKEQDRIAGFAAGGNDYVLKPFYPRELMARMKSLLSLHGTAPPEPAALTIGNIGIDLLSRKIRVEDKEVALTPKEYDLLLLLCKNPSRAYSRDTLLDLVWGESFYGSDRTVDTHIKSLRNKIKPYHYYIVTIWGYGYKFEP